jgi:ADP-ribose pyrophosphatase YjhB (NUDIX family)
MNKCNNCGREWHVYKQCKSPITSNGIINVNEKKEYLMICRKKTLGYVDFLRGKYLMTSKNHITNLISEMTTQEKKDLTEKKFNDLWGDLWGVKPDGSSDELIACEKLNCLKKGCTIGQEWVTLTDLLSTNTTEWTEPEWGFPKGRRNNYETDIMCALREYEEETGYDRKDMCLIKNIMPYEEIFTGSNYKSYKHKYFIAKSNKSVQKQNFQESEVSDIRWFSYDEAISKIRPYNIERKHVLSMVHVMLDEYIMS